MMAPVTDMNKLDIYKTPTCVTCGAIMRRLDAQGIPYNVIDITEDLAAGERLRQAGFLQAPVFGYRGKLTTIAGLPDITREIQSTNQKEAA
jgi:glutaredoxin